MTRPTGIRVFQRLFRAAAGVDLDKQDVKRYRAFVDAMIDDIAITGRNSAHVERAGRHRAGRPPHHHGPS